VRVAACLEYRGNSLRLCWNWVLVLKHASAEKCSCACADALEGTLQQRARMTHTGATVASAASAVKSAAQQVLAMWMLRDAVMRIFTTS